MTNSSLNITSKVDRPTVELYRAVDEAIETIGADYLVVGASARDLVFKRGYGIDVVRATEDTDYGIQISDWGQFEKLREVLVDKGFESTPAAHRLLSPEGLRLDIVPFGGVEGSESTITWPPKHDLKMSVLGFKDSMAAAITVSFDVTPELIVPVASAEGIALLKTIAWTDRETNQRRKDALDLVFAAKFYERIPYVDLYEDGKLLERFEFDVALVGAYLLGRGVYEISGNESKSYLEKFFRIGINGRKYSSLIDESLLNPFSPRDENEKLLIAYSEGFIESFND